MSQYAKSPGKKGYFKYIIYGLVLIFIILVVFDPIQKIPVGQRGLIYNNITGTVNEKGLKDGWHFIIPFIEELTVYPISEQSYSIFRSQESWLKGEDTSLWVPTKDHQRVGLDISFTYYFDENKLKSIYERFQGRDIYSIEGIYLDSWFKHGVISVITQNSLYDIYSERRSLIQQEILDYLRGQLTPLGIHLESILINEVRLTPESEAIILAETRRRAAVIEAMTESEVNQLISGSLTDSLIKLQMLEKLSDNLKLVIVPSTAENQLNLDTIINTLTEEEEKSSSFRQ